MSILALILLAVAFLWAAIWGQNQKLRAEDAERWVDEIVELLQAASTTDEQLNEHIKTLDS